MRCSKCKSDHNVKNGHIHGLQRYKCKDCGRSFTVELKSTAKPEDVKRQALQMYLEGLGFCSIARILHVSHVSVLKWIRKYGREIDSIRNDKPVKIMELDELHTYVGHKKTTGGFGLALVEMIENTLILSSVTEAQKQD
jgi:transposase-like protein